MSAEWEVQKALFSALSALGLTVYDAAPQAVDGGNAGAFPYVAIGAIVFSRWDVKAGNGFNFVPRVHTHSRKAGMQEVKQMQGQIYDRLHHGALTIPGYNLVLLQFQDSDVTRVASGAFHGVSEFLGMIEKA